MDMDWREFQHFASKEMSKHFGVQFVERNPIGFPKRFDMVSSDEQVIGDAKYLTLVGRKNCRPQSLWKSQGICGF